MVHSWSRVGVPRDETRLYLPLPACLPLRSTTYLVLSVVHLVIKCNTTAVSFAKLLKELRGKQCNS